MPYGKLYPINPGDFFQPLSVLLAVGAVGALISGWRMATTYRRRRVAPVVSFVILGILTPTVFWAMIGDPWDVSKGRLVLSNTHAAALVYLWFVWASVRVFLIAIGFVATVQCVSKRNESI